MIVIKILFFPLILIFFLLKNLKSHEKTSISQVWYTICPRNRCRICNEDSKKPTQKNKNLKFKLIIGAILLIILGVALTIILTPKNQDFLVKYSSNVNEYTFNIDVNCANKSLTTTQEISYINKTGGDLNCIKFHIYPNNFAKGAINKPVSSLYESAAYPNGINYSNFTLTYVNINNSAVEYALEGTDKDILCVYLSSNLKSNKRAQIIMEYTITLPNINHRFGYGENTINLGNFYPIACVFENGEFLEDRYTTNGDPFYSDMANYSCTISYDSDYVLASSGTQTKTTTQNNKKTTNIVCRASRDFALVLSDKFNIKETTIDNTKILYYYYNDENPESSISTAKKAIETFNEMIGTYEYPTLSVVETNFVYGGMEYPSLVMISDKLETHEDYEYTIVHEIGHQWFYAMVGNNEFAHGWMDEGLTEYITACFYERHPEYNKNIKDIIDNAEKSYMLFVEVYGSVLGEIDTSMDRKLNEFNTDPEYTYLTYVKGMIMFSNLRSVIGNNKFFKALQTYFNEFKGKNATPSDLIKCFQKASNNSIVSFFDSYLKGKVKVIELAH